MELLHLQGRWAGLAWKGVCLSQGITRMMAVLGMARVLAPACWALQGTLHLAGAAPTAQRGTAPPSSTRASLMDSKHLPDPPPAADSGCCMIYRRMGICRET